jgi:hypothetical protein
MSTRMVLTAISIYQCLMLILTSIVFLFLPVMASHQFFDSPFIDIFARCILWLYFAASYWSIGRAIKNGFRQKRNFFLVGKSVSTIVLLGLSAVMTSAFLGLLTNWSLTAFVPQLSSLLVWIVSFVNGVIYGTLILLQYVFLPEK